EDNARRQATPAQWAAFRSLWDGSLPDDESFRRAFETIRPLYFFDKRLAAASLAARAATRHRIAVRDFIIRHDYSRYDCRSELPGIEWLRRVGVGGHDFICPVDQAEEIHALVPNAELAIFEKSGHSPHVEERAALIERLRIFLDVPDTGRQRVGETR